MTAPTRLAQPLNGAATGTRVDPRRWQILGFLISAASLAGFVWWALHQETPTFPSTASDIVPLVIAVGIYAVITVTRGWRWHKILQRSGIRHHQADAQGLTVVGYMGNTVLPARGGEVLRILLMSERSDASKREILGSILAERVLDVVVLVLLFALLTWWQVAGSPTGQSPALLAIGATVCSGIAVAVYLRLRRHGRFERFAAAVRPVVRACRLLMGPVGIALAALTTLVWLMEAVNFWLVAQAVNVDVNAIEAVFLVVLPSLFALVPAAPGYVGTFDAALVFGLRALGVTGGQAVAFTLLVRFVLFVPITAVGLVLIVTRYGGLALLRRGS